MCTKNDNHMMFGYPSNNAKNQNFEKNEKKNNWRCYNFTHVYHKLQSYDIWFLKYGVRQIFLSFLTIFCPVTVLTTHKIKILKKRNICPEISFYKSVP